MPLALPRHNTPRPDRIHQAKKLVNHRLQVAPTPRLWCILGGLLNEDGPYMTAWELSRKRWGS